MAKNIILSFITLLLLFVLVVLYQRLNELRKETKINKLDLLITALEQNIAEYGIKLRELNFDNAHCSERVWREEDAERIFNQANQIPT
ncbi:hypothetical protein HDU92_001639 [Lobulomyces angularis]|nr:hypothetical protein HDU92_001639 [Lobulomyces angularis]